MNAFRRCACTAASAALVLGSVGLGAPAFAAGTVLADSGGSSDNYQDNCTTNNVTVASNQDSTPWEISDAGVGNLVDPNNGGQLTGQGVTVAVIDTGIQAQAQLNVAPGGQVLNGESGGDASDDDGHGTMVASIIAAQKSSDSANGMQGIAPGVTLLSFREAGCKATGGNDEHTMALAIQAAIQAGADVINISQDGYSDETDLRQAVQQAYDDGIVVVTSAGNQGDRDTTDSQTGQDFGVNPVTYPASYPDALAVGAVDQYGTVPTFSETDNHGVDYVGVVAPGVSVEGLLPNGKLAIDDGTSFASPYVAAEAALIIQEHGWADDHSADRAYSVMKIIEATADNLSGTAGFHTYSTSQGWGEADIQAALKADSGGGLVSSGATLPGLVPMVGDGPNADQAATNAPAAANAPAVKPEVAAVSNQQAADDQHWAYIALAIGALVAIVTLAAAAVTRDVARRRGGSPRG